MKTLPTFSVGVRFWPHLGMQIKYFFFFFFGARGYQESNPGGHLALQ
jgi:hypothetical protein